MMSFAIMFKKQRCTQGGEKGEGAPFVPPQKTLNNLVKKMQYNTKIETL
jgi:hypothetical protein